MLYLVTCLCVLFLREALADNVFSEPSQKTWEAFYKQKGQTTVRDGMNGLDHNYYTHLSDSHLRLDCLHKSMAFDKLPEDADPFPMCNILLKRVHSHVWKMDVIHGVPNKYDFYHNYVDETTTWKHRSTAPGLQSTVFGDSTGLEFPGDMENVPQWAVLHNDTSCSEQTCSCRQELTCKMSWMWYKDVQTVPPLGYDFGTWEGGILVSETSGGEPATRGMVSRGDYGGFDDLPFEYCRICAHKSCEKSLSSIDRQEVPERCRVGYAQTSQPKAWQKSCADMSFCSSQCPIGTWMTCTSGTPESCEYPPWLVGETYSHWAVKVASIENGITIPQISNQATLRRSYYQPANDISHCWPCALAAGITHYGRPTGKIHEVNGISIYAEFYCPGGAAPPVDCTLASNGAEVKAGSDMQGPNPQSTCQCLGGYYSPESKRDDQNNIILDINGNPLPMYQSKNPSALKCQICPAGFYCRFRADLAAPGYNGNTSCPIGQQKCPCPINHFCPEGVAVPRPCNMLNSCTQLQSLTQCVTGFQEEDAQCIPCRDCAQMGGKKGPCLNMIDLAQ